MNQSLLENPSVGKEDTFEPLMFTKDNIEIMKLEGILEATEKRLDYYMNLVADLIIKLERKEKRGGTF